MKKQIIGKTFRLISALALAALFFTGCSGSSGGSGSTENGTVNVGITDAPGDFATYTVDIVSLTLTRENGTVIQVLPADATVDFAQYVDLSEFLTATSVPAGVYKKVTMTLEYSNADIQVENEAGDTVAVSPSSIVDGNGETVSRLDVSVYLEKASALVVLPKAARQLVLDFNLQASNTVTFDESGNARVAVQPTLVAEVDKISTKPQTARGLLGDVNTAAGNFYLKLRPFYHDFNDPEDHFGQLLVTPDSNTRYEIGNTGYTGTEGFTALAALAENTPVIVRGKMTFSENGNTFVPTEIFAGNSVPGVSGDSLTGTILSRTGDTLVVRGAVYPQNGGTLIVSDTVTVALGEGTTVKKQDEPSEYAISALSPGQRVEIIGTYDDSVRSLDATAGWVRMMLTGVRGTVNETAPAFTMDVSTVDMKPVSLFTFTGTGESTDSDPSNYVIGTGSIDTSDIQAGDPVLAYGFVTEFGKAGSESTPYDFTASALVNLEAVPVIAKLTWKPGSTAPFTSLTGDGIDVAVPSSGLGVVMVQASIPLSVESGTLRFEPTDNGFYTIRTTSSSDSDYIFTTYASFESKLAELLAGGKNRVKTLSAVGPFDDAAMTVKAATVNVEVQIIP